MEQDIDAIIRDLYKDFRERSKEVKRYTQFIQIMAAEKAAGLSKSADGELVPIAGFDLDRDLSGYA